MELRKMWLTCKDHLRSSNLFIHKRQTLGLLDSQNVSRRHGYEYLTQQFEWKYLCQVCHRRGRSKAGTSRENQILVDGKQKSDRAHQNDVTLKDGSHQVAT